jgi:type VI secretion system secreted protein Hcp
MAVDYFLKIDGIKGESKDAKHRNEIELLSWSWGESNAGTTFPLGGSGGGSGKVSVQDINFHHKIDKATPLLLKQAAGGTHIKKVELYVRQSAGKKTQPDYLTYTLTDCLVSSISHGGSGESLPTESISLNFTKLEMSYRLGSATYDGDLVVPPGDPAGSA